MTKLTRLSFFALFGLAASAAASSPVRAAGGSGLTGPATVPGSPLNLKGVAVVNQLPPRLQLSSANISVHYPPTNAELQQEIDNLSKQISTLQQNEKAIWAFGDEVQKLSLSTRDSMEGITNALARHWHQYWAVGEHSTSSARM